MHGQAHQPAFAVGLYLPTYHTCPFKCIRLGANILCVSCKEYDMENVTESDSSPTSVT